MSSSICRALFILSLLYFSSVSAFAENEGLFMKMYKNFCPPQAEDMIKEQVQLLCNRHKSTAFSWLFDDCFVESRDASSRLLDSPRRVMFENIKNVQERDCPGVVSCSDILMLSAIVAVRISYLSHAKNPISKMCICIMFCFLSFLPQNESLKVVLDRLASIGINTAGGVALLASHSAGRTYCMKLAHRLYPDRVEQRCPHRIPEAVQYVRNDRGAPMKLDNNYYRNILDNKGLIIVDRLLATDERTKPYVEKMAMSQDYFFMEFARAIALLAENNPLTGIQHEIQEWCDLR
ncbi:peroxidase 42-like [Salvia hispanica]|uniref:peroxidase 42-like n=1 Tax=Salvia hispanica TaxID=49212 RepID=UPI002009D0CA|nr:peroxidase 42-like [Salvia hispanica]